jgi:hypothetical protein
MLSLPARPPHGPALYARGKAPTAYLQSSYPWTTVAWPKASMLISSVNMLTAARILQLPAAYHPLLPSPANSRHCCRPHQQQVLLPLSPPTQPGRCSKCTNHHTASPQHTLAPKTTTTIAAATISITATLASCKTHTQGGEEALQGRAVEG